MPIYEYSCPECQEEFEVMRPVCDMDLKTLCPKCGKQSRRMVSVFASKEGYTVKVPSKGAFRGEVKKTAPAAAKKAPAARAAAKPRAATKTRKSK